MKAFGIFEGGGAKGLAHIGALKSAEDKKIDFIYVAGASAGALMAAFIASGFKADELYELHNRSEDKIFNLNFIDQLDPEMWEKVKWLRSELENRTSWGKARLLARPKTLSIIYSIIVNKGIFDADKFENWIEVNLKKKITPTSEDGKIRFRDMPTLTIVAADFKSKKIKVFNKKETEDYSVAKAVRASASIPFVFKPLIDGQMILVDGGVLSNFPAWVFDEQRQTTREVIPTPTFGFRLVSVSEPPSQAQNNEKYGFANFVSDFFGTIFSGDNVLEVREIEDLNLIPIEVRTNTLDFDMTPDDRDKLYLEGREGANKFFRNYIGPRDPAKIEEFLKFLAYEVKDKLKNPTLHLRFNVALPIEPKKNRIRILYTYNMDDDFDDRLAFEMGEGCIGSCWSGHTVVWADMDIAKQMFESKWRMSKHQQALVRQKLKSLISLPIFHPQKFDKNKLWTDNPLLGVLSMDSDDNLLEEFVKIEKKESSDLYQILVDATWKLGEELYGI